MNVVSRYLKTITVSIPFYVLGYEASVINSVEKIKNLLFTRSFESPLFQIIGPLVTFLTAVVFSISPQEKDLSQSIFSIMHVLIIYSAFIGGLRSGINSAAITWLFIAFYLSEPTKLFHYGTENLRNLILFGGTTFFTAVFSGILKHRSNLYIQEAKRRMDAEFIASSLKEHEKEYRMIFYKNPNPMWINDPKTLKYLAVNTAAIKLYGYSEAEFLKMTLKDIRNADQIPSFMKYQKSFPQDSGIINAGEWIHRKKDGSAVEVEVTASTIHFGNQVARLVLLKDITQRKRLENLRNTFISIAAHELKTPITTLKLLTEALIKKPQNETNFRDHKLKLIETELDRLTLLINDLLDISQIEAGQLKLRLQKDDINSLINSTIGQLQYTAEQRRLLLKTKPLPKVTIDPGRIKQVLFNLISNSIKHTRSNGTITISSRLARGTLFISVKDDGEGIPKDKLKKVFERFYRIESQSQKDGFGLGLYISREIIERHGGKIWVNSKLGKGSTFTFSLPLG